MESAHHLGELNTAALSTHPHGFLSMLVIHLQRKTTPRYSKDIQSDTLSSCVVRQRETGRYPERLMPVPQLGTGDTCLVEDTK